MDGITKRLWFILFYFSFFFNGNDYYANRFIHWADGISNYKTLYQFRKLNHRTSRNLSNKTSSIGPLQTIFSVLDNTIPKLVLLFMNIVLVFFLISQKKKHTYNKVNFDPLKTSKSINNGYQWEQLKEKYSINDSELDNLMAQYLKKFPATNVIEGMEKEIIAIENNFKDKKKEEAIESVLFQTSFFLNIAIKVDEIFQLFEKTNIFKSFTENPNTKTFTTAGKTINFQRIKNYIDCTSSLNISFACFNGSFIRIKKLNDGTDLNVLFSKKKNDIEYSLLLKDLMEPAKKESIEAYLDDLIECLKLFSMEKKTQ